MLYYRYRSGTTISIKELMYEEMFFASTSECNDPYEGKSFAVLGKDEAAWKRLITFALRGEQAFSIEYLQNILIAYFVEKAPISMDEVLQADANAVASCGSNIFEETILKNMLTRVKEYVSVYVPTEKYFVSFAKRSDNLLMWSHYANNHRGYCLVFRTRDGAIYQSTSRRRKSVSYKTPKSFSPQMSFNIDDSFKVRDIEYVLSPEPINGFLCFPEAVAGKNVSKEEVNEHIKAADSVYFQKHKVWDYEEEARIVLSSGIPWLTGERLSLSPHQRLLHYDSTQLVGIILGAKMSKEQRNTIREIITEKIDRWFDITGDKIISDFVFFDEVLSEKSRDICIEPREIVGLQQSVTSDSPDFQRRYERWKEGYALHFSEGGCRKIQVK